MSAKKSRLGRGLDALISGASTGAEPENERSSNFKLLPIAQLQPGKYQPRTGMDQERLNELADSIRAQGLIQPIIVREIGRDRYEIIAGERRWRASKIAELKEVPCVIREVDDHTSLAMALIENIQREDLSPLEEANALKRLIEEFSLTHQQAAEAVGRSRAAVSNLLRLLELPKEIKALLESHRLEMGHARALLTLPATRAIALAHEAADKGWSVRELEQYARASQAAATGQNSKVKAADKNDPDVNQLENELSEKLGTRVSIKAAKGGKGKLVIEYFSLDELEGILSRIR